MNITENPIITLGETVIFGTNDQEQHPNFANAVPALVVQAWNGEMANLKLQAFGEYAPGGELRGSVHHKSVADEQGFNSWWLYRDEYQEYLTAQQTPPVDNQTE